MFFIPLNRPEPFECETCGTSYEDLTVEFTGDKGAPWRVELTIGCYGGASFVGSRAEVIGWLREEADPYVTPGDLADAIATLEEA